MTPTFVKDSQKRAGQHAGKPAALETARDVAVIRDGLSGLAPSSAPIEAESSPPLPEVQRTVAMVVDELLRRGARSPARGLPWRRILWHRLGDCPRLAV